VNSAASEPVLIGIDWGTSSLRAFLIGGDGQVMDRVVNSQGILQVKDGDFNAVFRQLVSGWSKWADLPVVASGMITSRNGWFETPYVNVPTDAADLAAALVPFEADEGRTINFVTGVTTEHDGAPDVMRGEETQIIGAAALGFGDGVFVLPGTHSKWITVQNDQIQDYATFMTGEIFGALKEHSILGLLMADGAFSQTGFQRGVEAGLTAGAGLLHKLFHVRTLPLFGKLAETATHDYLSGLLIGAELHGSNVLDQDSGPVIIVGRDDLADRYEIALEVAGMTSKRAPDDIVALGHFLIAKSAGFLS